MSVALDQAIEDSTYATLDLSPKTQRWYREKLRHFRDWATHQHLTLQDIA